MKKSTHIAITIGEKFLSDSIVFIEYGTRVVHEMHNAQVDEVPSSASVHELLCSGAWPSRAQRDSLCYSLRHMYMYAAYTYTLNTRKNLVLYFSRKFAFEVKISAFKTIMLFYLEAYMLTSGFNLKEANPASPAWRSFVALHTIYSMPHKDFIVVAMKKKFGHPTTNMVAPGLNLNGIVFCQMVEPSSPYHGEYVSFPQMKWYKQSSG